MVDYCRTAVCRHQTRGIPNRGSGAEGDKEQWHREEGKHPYKCQGKASSRALGIHLFACFYLSLTWMASWDLMVGFYRRVGEAILNYALTSGWNGWVPTDWNGWVSTDCTSQMVLSLFICNMWSRKEVSGIKIGLTSKNGFESNGLIDRI